MRRGSADSIRASGEKTPHQQAGYKAAICLPVTTKSVLAFREASIQGSIEDEARPWQRNYYCTPSQNRVIEKRAKQAGMNRSPFLVACALHEDAGGGEKLVLDAEEQHTLLEQVAPFHAFAVALDTELPDIGMTPLEALEFLVRAAKRERPEP